MNRNHQKSGKIFSILPYILFTALVFLLYSNTFQSPYIFDDWQHIEANPHIRMKSISGDAFKQAAFKSPLKRRPVAYITLAINYYFDGYDLLGYHLFNVIIHLGTACFLFMFLQTTLILTPQKFKYSDWLPLTAVLIWLVHPLQIQSVTYIIQRMNSLAAMFYILSMLTYVRARLTEGMLYKTLLFIGSACSGLLALGSKEIAVTLPLLILLYEWFFLQDLDFVWIRKKFFMILGGGLMLLGIALLFLGPNPIASIINGYAIRDFTMLQRVFTEFRVVIFYITLLLLPLPGRLNIDHEVPISYSLFDPFTTLLSLLLILGLFAYAVFSAPKNRLVSFSILWFLGNLILESSIIGLEIIFEHRTYLPSMFAIFAGTLIGKHVLQSKWLQITAAVLILIIFSFWTYQRNMIWQDEIKLRHDAVMKSPTKPRALAILANALERNHRYDEAAVYYRKTLSLKPRNADEIHYNLGNVLLAQGNIDEAIEHFNEAVSMNPEVAVMRLNLAYALTLKDRDHEAYLQLQELLRLHPENPRAHNNLGILLMKHERLKEAIYHFSEAVRIKPNFKQARINLERARGRLENKLIPR